MTQLNYCPEFNRVHEPLPSGLYTVMFEECKERTAVSGEEYLTFVWRIVDGQYAGRKVSDNIYCFASDSDYKEKAMFKLDRICQIFEIDYLENTDLLWQKQCLIHTGIRINAQGQSFVYIKGYWPLPEKQGGSAGVDQGENA